MTEGRVGRWGSNGTAVDFEKLALHLNNLLPDIWGARKMNYILFGELLLVSKEKFGNTIYDLCVLGCHATTCCWLHSWLLLFSKIADGTVCRRDGCWVGPIAVKSAVGTYFSNFRLIN